MTTYHFEVLQKFPANTWVKPTNKDCNDYDVFTDLFEAGQVERKIEYNYRGANNNITGSSVYFRYSI